MSNDTPADDASQSLLQVQASIDEIDEKLQSLITERAAASLRLAQLTNDQSPDSSVDGYQPERDARVFRGVLERHQGQLDSETMLRIFREIVSASRALEQPLQVSYLGPEGTYSHAAVDRYFGHDVHALPEPGIADIFAAVESGRTRFGVVPVENSTEGAVNQTLDLLTQTSLRVCGELGMRIQHCLLSKAAALDDIHEVHAHPQALAQCKQWLSTHLPAADLVSESSNAAAAKLAMQGTHIAAIAGETAAQLYELPILMKGIEDEKNNTTRFLVIGNQVSTPSGDDASLLLVSAPHRPGGLRSLLGPLEDAGVSMTRIESRPSRSGMWEYVFFINVNGHEHDEKLSTVLTQLREYAPLVKVLGSYPRAL